MMTHVVFFRLKPEHRERAAELAERLVSMRGKITELREIEAGVDVARSERAWDVALITRFDDAAGLAVYRDHPVHLDVLAFVHEVCGETAVVDYES